jgi:DNA-binding CsgD family transcriptional regulator
LPADAGALAYSFDMPLTRHPLEPVFERTGLTAKERAVARYLLEGKSSPEIAEIENNSPKTIRQHISSIYGKCAVNSRAEFFHMMYSAQHERAI